MGTGVTIDNSGRIVHADEVKGGDSGVHQGHVPLSDKVPASMVEKHTWLARDKVELVVGVPGDGSGGELRDAALLVVAYNRPDYLRKTLDSLATVSSLQDVSVYVSQDGYDVGVAGVAAAAQTRGRGLMR